MIHDIYCCAILLLLFITMRYCVFWDVPLGSRQRDRHGIVINYTFLGGVMQTYLYTQMPYVIFVSVIIDCKQLLFVNLINLSISLLRDTHFINYSKHRHLFHSKNVCSSLFQGKHLPFSPSPLQGKHIYPFPLPHFASIFFAYLWSFRWPNYIVTLPRYFSFRLPHLNISNGPPSDELDNKSRRTWLIKNFSQLYEYWHEQVKIRKKRWNNKEIKKFYWT